MSTRVRSTMLLAFVLAACSEHTTTPTEISAFVPGTRPVSSISPTANTPCNVHWAAGVSGSWFDATKWSPAAVPTAASSVCIDAAGTYLVTLDPAVDADAVNILALDVGGAVAFPTLRYDGTSVTMNVSQGVLVRANAILESRAFTGAVLTSVGTITNQGTLAAIAVCGSCGTGNVVNADIINQGTLSSAAIFTLGKVGGQYENTGTVSITNGGTLAIPATAGNASFAQNGGVITGNGNFSRLTMGAGTFTMNGGKARKRDVTTLRPIVVLDGANLVISPTATDSAHVAVLASSTAARTVSGDMPLLTTLWLSGPIDGQPGVMTLVGSPVNNGRIILARQVDASGGDLTLGGTGRLTSAGILDQSLNSGAAPTFHFALDVTNNGSWLVTSGSSASLEKASGQYINNGTIDLGPNSSSDILRVLGSTLESSGTISGGTVSVDNGRLKAAGTSPTRIAAINGGIIEPGMSPGRLSVYGFAPATTGTLRIELGGDTVGTGYDQLDATTTAVMQGTLDIVAVNGFDIGRCGQQFDVVTHPVPSGFGSFATVNGLNPAPGRAFRLIYLGATATTKGVVRLVGFDGAQKICVGPNPVGIKEGSPGVTYAIALDHAPTANVTVSATANAQVTVSPASLVFTSANWQMPQFFTVTAVDDAVAEGAHTGTVTQAVTTTDATYLGFIPAALTANITDNDVNLPPVATNDVATTAEDTPVQVNVLTNDSDPENATLLVSNVAQPSHGTTQIAAAGTAVLYTPSANYNGPDSFTYTLSDGTMTATGHVAVTVTAAPDAPVAVSDQASVHTAISVTVSVLNNDSDVDGDPLTVTQVSVPSHGTAIINAGQTVTYQSVTGYVGADAFTYTVSDGTGRSATATVSINVISATANTPPEATRDFAVIPDKQDKVRIPVLDNDFDADGDRLTITNISAPASGTAEVQGKAIVYTISKPLIGRDFFIYTISDGFGGTSTGEVMVVWPVTGLVDYGIDNFYGSYVRNPSPQTVAYVGFFYVTMPAIQGTVTLEIDLPTDILSVGGSKRTNGTDLVPDANCSIVYSGGVPVQYRCNVSEAQASSKGLFTQTFAIGRPLSATSFTMTARLLVPSGIDDPNPGNNSKTIQASVNCFANGPPGSLSCNAP